MAAERMTIPGQERLTEELRLAAARDALGHAVILSGSGDLLAAARFVAAAMECEGPDRPCGQCGPCRKVLRGIHPDVAVVEDPEHRNVAVEVLRRAAADAYILPNEGRRKVYIFPDCSLLEAKAQNVLLKVLEEGPPHAAFLFCAPEGAAVLPTIRSRAAEWRMAEGEEAAAGSRALRLCELLCEGKRAALVPFCVQLENSKLSREDLQAMLAGARDLTAAGLAACYGSGGTPLARRMASSLGRRALAGTAEVLERFIRQCNYNVGVGHLTGALAVELMDQVRNKSI